MAETTAATLNITDIGDAVKVIDYAFEQGTFKGIDNVRQIILVRDRLNMFVSSAAVTEPVNQAAELNNANSELKEAEETHRKPHIRRKTA